MVRCRRLQSVDTRTWHGISVLLLLLLHGGRVRPPNIAAYRPRLLLSLLLPIYRRVGRRRKRHVQPLLGAFGPPDANKRGTRVGRLVDVIWADRPAVAVARRQSRSNGSVDSCVCIASLCGWRLQFFRCATAVAVGVITVVIRASAAAAAAGSGSGVRIAVFVVFALVVLVLFARSYSMCLLPLLLSLSASMPSGVPPFCDDLENTTR